MAEKRMLSKKVLDTDAFLDMPLSAQALYFHLAINADDEGFIGNPKRIRDYIGAGEDDLALLIEKRFVILFKSGVVVIRHWKIHNTLRRDRSHPTLFAEEKAGLIVEDNGAYSDRFFDSIHVNQTVTALQPNDNHVSTEDKIEEDRLKEDKGEEVNTPENEDPNPSKRFRKPSISDIAAYCAANGYKLDAHRFYDYYESNGWRVGKTPMKNWQAAIRNWERNEQNKFPAPTLKPEIDVEKYKREDE